MRQNRPIGLYLLSLCILLLSPFALYAGWLFISDPSGSKMQLPISWLANSPFSNYLIPGLLLFTVLGVFPLIALVALWLKPRWRIMHPLEQRLHEHWSWLAGLTVGLALVIWISVQMTMLAFFWLQPVMLGLGLLIIILSLLPSVRRFYAL